MGICIGAMDGGAIGQIIGAHIGRISSGLVQNAWLWPLEQRHSHAALVPKDAATRAKPINILFICPPLYSRIRNVLMLQVAGHMVTSKPSKRLLRLGEGTFSRRMRYSG